MKTYCNDDKSNWYPFDSRGIPRELRIGFWFADLWNDDATIQPLKQAKFKPILEVVFN